jgi:hypothetical protein
MEVPNTFFTPWPVDVISDRMAMMARGDGCNQQ